MLAIPNEQSWNTYSSRTCTGLRKVGSGKVIKEKRRRKGQRKGNKRKDRERGKEIEGSGGWKRWANEEQGSLRIRKDGRDRDTKGTGRWKKQGYERDREVDGTMLVLRRRI